MRHLLLFAAILALSMLSCQKKDRPVADPLVENIDSTTTAGTDFFTYANGGWFRRHTIPADENYIGIWKMVQDSVNDAVKAICENSAKAAAPKGSNQQKIGDFYFSGMDTATIEKLGLSPLEDEFRKIEAIHDKKDLTSAVAHLQSLQAGPMFSFYVGRDDKNSARNAVFVGQGGLGLPDRDYYFNTDTRNVHIRAEYVAHMAKIFELIGDDAKTADKKSKSVMQLETSLAKASRKLEDLRDPYANYHKMATHEIQKLTPSINWPEMTKDMGLNDVDSIIVGQPEFFAQLENDVKSVSLEDWKTYLRWKLINSYASFLNKKFDDQNFYFFSTILSGAKEQRPRWKRVVTETNFSLGELVGQEYVAGYLPPHTKEKMVEIGNALMAVYKEHIQNLDWMSSATKEKAQKKLSTVMQKIAYPDKWTDYSALDVDRGAYVLNVMRANHWRFNHMVQRYGKPVDRTEWRMTPQTYNAGYDPTNNEIVIPACNIIVPGYSKELPDDAVLYGVVGGSTFGHEITHGFDDQGSQYDEVGNLNDWWTKEDRGKFNQKAQIIVRQFNGYTVLDSLHIRGLATLGENIADLGGVLIGYEAFKRTEQGRSQKKISGLTGDQRYFLSYAYAWLVKYRDEMQARQIMSDVHAPAKFRVNGPLANIPEFYAAFGIKPGDPMYRADSVRVKIW
jgi:putative endopeptidase